MSAPSVPSALPGRQPRTTASIVRSRLILSIPTRSPGMYGASSSLATTPSAPCSHGSAPPGSVVAGVRSIGASTSCQARAPFALRQFEQHLVLDCQHVEGDEARRRLLGEHVHARLGGMDALA